MIPRNLIDYVKVYKNHFSADLCKEAVKNLKKQEEWQLHNFYEYSSNTYISYDNELSISWKEIPETAQLNKAIWHALEKYVLHDFENFKPWWGGWAGHSFVRFNKYDKNTQMKLHCDQIQSLFDGERKGVPTLTVLGLLNGEYEGGEFVMFKDTVIDMEPGTVIVFPSSFMYPHEVKPITSGVRYSCVSWSW
jgi:predicted 2-oxoglutarate/Fe(II)-dependent dioxygenase YbiX